MTTRLTLPAHTRDWPAPVVATMQRRMEIFDDAIRGDAFDLAELDGGRIPWPDGPFDTIVSVAELPRLADLAGVARAVLERVRPDGCWVLIEPTARTGLQALLRSSFGRPAALRGLHLNRDVPWTLRHCGWRFDRMERDLVAGAPWSLRFLANGVGRPQPIPEPDDGGQ